MKARILVLAFSITTILNPALGQQFNDQYPATSQFSPEARSMYQLLGQQYNHNNAVTNPGVDRTSLAAALEQSDHQDIRSLAARMRQIHEQSAAAKEAQIEAEAAVGTKVGGIASLLFGRTSGVIRNKDGSIPTEEEWNKYRGTMAEGAMSNPAEARLAALTARDRLNSTMDAMRTEAVEWLVQLHQSTDSCADVPLGASVVRYQFGTGLRVTNNSSRTLEDCMIVAQGLPDNSRIDQAILEQSIGMGALFQWFGMNFGDTVANVNEAALMNKWLYFKTGSFAYVERLAPGDSVILNVCTPPQLMYLESVEIMLFSRQCKANTRLAAVEVSTVEHRRSSTVGYAANSPRPSAAGSSRSTVRSSQSTSRNHSSPYSRRREARLAQERASNYRANRAQQQQELQSSRINEREWSPIRPR